MYLFDEKCVFFIHVDFIVSEPDREVECKQTLAVSSTGLSLWMLVVLGHALDQHTIPVIIGDFVVFEVYFPSVFTHISLPEPLHMDRVFFIVVEVRFGYFQNLRVQCVDGCASLTHQKTLIDIDNTVNSCLKSKMKIFDCARVQ